MKSDNNEIRKNSTGFSNNVIRFKGIVRGDAVTHTYVGSNNLFWGEKSKLQN